MLRQTISPTIEFFYHNAFSHPVFKARCNIYISRLCYDVSVRLSVRWSVTEVHWSIIANIGLHNICTDQSM